MQPKQSLGKADRDTAYQRYYDFASLKFKEANDPKLVLKDLEEYTRENPADLVVGGDATLWILLRTEDTPIIGKFDEFREKGIRTDEAFQRLIKEGNDPVKILLLMHASNHHRSSAGPAAVSQIKNMRRKGIGYLFGGIALVVGGGLGAIAAFDAGYIVFALLSAVLVGLTFIVYGIYAIYATTSTLKLNTKW
jgi:hypothetical protein